MSLLCPSAGSIESAGRASGQLGMALPLKSMTAQAAAMTTNPMPNVKNKTGKAQTKNLNNSCCT